MISHVATTSRPRRLRDHRKSRGGCVRCRSKKIKCSETKPACTHCVKGRVPCRYPLDPESVLAPAAAPQPNRTLRTTPFTFSHDDLRAFDRFLTVAYPPLPLGTARAWKNDIPAMSHEFSFCMHGLLALGLSHVSFGEALDERRKIEAKHRAFAMRGVNNIIAKGNWNATENDALLATLYAMMFACSYAGDSIYDFFSLVRAVGLTTERLKHSPNSSVLVPGAGEASDFVVGVKSRLQLDNIDQQPLAEALASLAKLGSLPMDDQETQLHGMLVHTLQLLKSGDTNGYFVISQAIAFVANRPPGRFESLVCPTNSTAVVLLAHTIAVEALTAPLIMHGSDAHAGKVNARACGTCVTRLYQHCPVELKCFIEWPLRFCVVQEHRFRYGLKVKPI